MKSFCTAVLLGVITLSTTSCFPGRSATVGTVTQLGTERIEELASFRCVTEQTAVTLRSAFAAGDPRYQRGQQLYDATRQSYNQIIEGIATDVIERRRPDAQAYWNMFGRAVDSRNQLVTYADQEARAFGFIGISTLIAAATPFAQRAARQYVERRARDYVAGYIRSTLMLPAFAQASQSCIDG